MSQHQGSQGFQDNNQSAASPTAGCIQTLGMSIPKFILCAAKKDDILLIQIERSPYFNADIHYLSF